MENCFMCGADGDGVATADRWNFRFDGVDDIYWICRECHGQFRNLEDFDTFRRDEAKFRLYHNVSTLRRLLVLNAPECVLATAVKVILGTALRQESLAVHMRKELEKQHVREELEKVLGKQ